MTPTLELTQTGDAACQVALRPEGGNPATLYVVPVGGTYYVKAQPDGPGYISQHRQFEAAVKSAIHRGKRYLASCQRSTKRKAVTA